ncbi:MAG: hypothetical protein IJB01_01800, partial [Bacteroidaceae bacterium]|nr:hypothetical protein [Bacteroidaceae bacterium]
MGEITQVNRIVIPWFVFTLNLLSFVLLIIVLSHTFRDRKVRKRSRHTEIPVDLFFVVNTAFTATRAAPISSVLRT